MNRASAIIAAALFAAVFVADRASAQKPVSVDLELILMADASGSVDTQEFILQRRGYASALRDPRVLDAIRSGRLGRIAISYVEWSGPDYQYAIQPWTVVSNRAEIESVARRLEDHRREIYGGGTAPGDAILYALAELRANGYRGRRLVIDVSGDDTDIDGLPVSDARDRAVASGVVINGLPIVEDYPELEQFFRDNVIGGPGAFVIAAKSFLDFGVAVRKKLIREIAGGTPAAPDLASTGPGRAGDRPEDAGP